MEAESPMQEVVYGTTNDDNHVMSEKVQALAGSIYQEFERMMEKYDEVVVKELMPLVVNVLENLDISVMENQEHEVELELLREDNEQLVTQYEREKQLRKVSEQRLLEIEYAVEDDRRSLQSKVESLESIVRMLELKSKNSSDHASRLEDKEIEMKKEYSKLHDRYTELFKTHMDYMERTKILFGTDRIENLSNKVRPNLNYPYLKSESTLFNLTGGEITSKSVNSPLDFSTLSPNHSSGSSASLKSELQEAQYSSVMSPTSPKQSKRKPLIDPETSEKGQLTDPVGISERGTATKGGWVDGFESDMNDISISTPEIEDVEVEDISQCSLGDRVKRELPKRPNTLYQELIFHDSDALGEMDEGADITDSESGSEHDNKVTDNFFGMGKEVENLIMENNELLATKNALNIVKDDLIAKVDELTSEQEILREEIKSLLTVKNKLKEKVADLEEELKKSKEELEKSKTNKSDDEEDVPMAQRKRFTRVEMARVLMERNQYKERLMELQEAVRWTEMIRASRSDHSLESKRSKSSLWKIFSSLFNSNDKPPRKSMPYVNVHYNAPTSHVSPALDTMRKKRLGDRHRGLDFLDSELASERLQQQRAKERREQYKQVRAHVRKDDGRMQAYGWSLPTRPSGPGKSEDTTLARKPLSSHVPVPVPVYCRPLLEKEPGMKIWCAAGVNLSGGRTADGGCIVGGSVFYSDVCEKSDSKNIEHLSEVDKLNHELKENEKERREHEEMELSLSSLVWICTSTHSNSKVNVVDGNNPSDILDSFHVCSSHLLSIASVPGAKESDYQTDEEFAKLGKEIKNKRHLSEEKRDGYIQAAVDENSTKIGNITFVSCSTGTTSRPPSPTSDKSNGLDNSDAKINNFSNKSEPDNKSASEIDLQAEQLKIVNSHAEKMSSVLPTMWLGSQDGNIYVHSSVAQWWRCIHSVKLKDSVLCIVHVNGRVFAALADGTVAVFHRAQDGQWDLTNFHLLDLGHPHHSVRCMTVVHSKVWCGYRNCIHVVDPKTLTIEISFDAHPRKESQIRQMAWTGDGVWVTIRLDSTLRLYHAHTHQHLQDVDIEPYVSKMLGTGKLGFSFVRITALQISCNRLWMGTGNGVVISVPLAENKRERSCSESGGKAPGAVLRVYSDSKDNVTPASFIPYCSMAQAQLSFHGHKDAVKFFVAVPGQAKSEASSLSLCEKDKKKSNRHEEEKRSVTSESSLSSDSKKAKSMLVVSGGEGYIDFRIGDEEDGEGIAPVQVSADKKPQRGLSKGDRSHLIVWQVSLGE